MKRYLLNNRLNAVLICLSALLFLSYSPVHAQIPKFNSNSAAKPTVYLDFDGHFVTGTGWNFDSSIHAKPSGLSQAAITEIFNRVAEDYRIFNLNITTDSGVFAKAPVDKRVRVIITPTNKWYGEAGGVAYVGSFSWGDNTPAWVFSNLLQNNAKYIGEAVSHEAGHTLGLQHQSTFDKNCNLVTEYAEGLGEGEISWAPIMGVGYYKNLTTWTIGKSIEGCDIIQNDIDIISTGINSIGLRTDDVGNTRQTAAGLTLNGSNFLSNGMISTAADKDVFKFVLPKNAVFHSKVTPNNVGSGNSGANMDVKLSLINSNGDTIGRYNPPALLSASVDTSLKAGTYYMVVDGVANTNLSDYGSIGYYLLDGSINIILPVTSLELTGKMSGQNHILNWKFITDEKLKSAEVETSSNGVDFARVTTLDPSVTAYQSRPFGNGAMYYRIKMITIQDERAYYSNIISLQYNTSGRVSLLSNMVTGTALVSVDAGYMYQLMDETGRLIQKGKLSAGTNTISINTVKKGLLLLRVHDDREQHLFKLVRQ